jgi:hypothetical protein
MTVSVYKITRTDGLEYVGITVNTKQRLYQHKKSKRFECGISAIEILWEGDSYDQAEELEEYYINLYDTYSHGLNMTPTGKGLNEDCKFNTFGYKFTKQSRKKMSETAKGRIPWIKGKHHSEKTKKLFSEQRKGKSTTKKITDEQLAFIIHSFNNDTIVFDNEFIKASVKKTDRCKVVSGVDYSILTSSNGKKLNKVTLYAKYFAEQFGTTSQLIRGYITGERTRC